MHFIVLFVRDLNSPPFFDFDGISLRFIVFFLSSPAALGVIYFYITGGVDRAVVMAELHGNVVIY